MMAETSNQATMPLTRNGRYSRMFWCHDPAPTIPTAITYSARLIEVQNGPSRVRRYRRLTSSHPSRPHRFGSP